MNAPALGPGEGEQLPAEEYVARLVVELVERAAVEDELAVALVLVASPGRPPGGLPLVPPPGGPSHTG